jgi:hypothetical protein
LTGAHAVVSSANALNVPPLIEFALLPIRWSAGALFLIAGLRKVARPTLAARTLLGVQAQPALVIGRGLGVLELSFGAIILLGLLMTWPSVAAVILPAFLATSVCGTVLLARGASCGCGLPLSSPLRVRRLWFRNMLLFGMTAFAAMSAPSFAELFSSGHPGTIALSIAPIPPLVFVLAAPMLASRLRSMGVVHQRDTGHTISYPLDRTVDHNRGELA